MPAILRVPFAAILLAPALATALPDAAPPASTNAVRQTAAFVVTADRPDGVYRQGEPIVFSVRMTENGKPVAGRKLAYTLQGDGGFEKKGELISAPEPVTVTTRLDCPGWINLKVTGSDAAGKPIPWWTLTGIAGAAVDPFQVRTGQAAPADFDAFWADQKTRLAKVPLNLSETPGAQAPAETRFRALTIKADIGTGLRPLTALVTFPTNAAPKSLGARLSFPGAGIRSAAFNTQENTISLTMNVHGVDDFQPEAYYLALRNGGLKDYIRLGAGDRETFYYRGVFLRILRALDYVKSRPEWDGKTLVVTGGSQGGGLALVAAGLDPAVSRCVAGMPALCDHLGYTRNQFSGWPQLVPLDRKTKQPLDEAIAKTSGYYDAAVFAARIRVPVEVSIGLRDTTCPPTSVFAAFNALATTNKTLWIYPDAGHMLQGRKVELHPEGPQP